MKTILILSTEPWGKMMLSKMHYATELAAMGNKVYFVNPPLPDSKKGLVSINEQFKLENIVVINIKPIKGFLFFRHKLPFVFKKLSNTYIKGILHQIPEKITEVWCFNPHLFTDLKKFNAEKNFLFLYDFYKGDYISKLANNADALISVSQLILDHYADVRVPKLLMQHGLSTYFADIAEQRIKEKKFNLSNNKIKIGYVGNLLRGSIDIPITRRIIEDNAEKEFHFWGPNSLENNNVAGNSVIISDEMKSFLEFLKKAENVFLRGTKTPQQLAYEINEIDAFLFLYSTEKDVNKASNSHKIVEYLSTGKAVISTFVSNYSDSDLLYMCSPDNNDSLIAVFNDVINDLAIANAPEKQEKRIAFALENTYQKHIQRIQNFIS